MSAMPETGDLLELLTATLPAAPERDDTAEVVDMVALDDSLSSRREGADLIIAAINAAADADNGFVSSRTTAEHLDRSQVNPKQFSAMFGHLSRANWLIPAGADESGNTASRNATKLIRRFRRPERIPADWAEVARRRRREARASS